MSFNTRSEGEIVTKEGGSRFICNDISWVNYEEKLETNILFQEAYERFHTGMLEATSSTEIIRRKEKSHRLVIHSKQLV